MLHPSIINKIKAKYGRDVIYSADCEFIAEAINKGHSGPIVSISTIKRLLGFAGTPETAPTPRANTLDIIAKWLEYDSYKSLLASIGVSDEASEFTSMQTIDVKDLDEGCQIQVRYHPSRVIVMTYMGDGQFMVNESVNSKLKQGDRICLTHLVLHGKWSFSTKMKDSCFKRGMTRMKSGLTSHGTFQPIRRSLPDCFGNRQKKK